MKRLPLLSLLSLMSLMLLPTMALARQSAQGDCVLGGKVVVTNGLNSTTKVMASYPSCTVTVSIHGGGLATIYSDNAGTILANPFTAGTNGHWQFYGDNSHYDILLSGGTPQAMPSSFTYSDIILDDTAQNSTAVCSLVFSSSISFGASSCSDFTLTLTGNVTSSAVAGAITGQQLIVSVCQDSTGGRTFAWPGNFTRPPTIASTAGACTNASFFYDGANWRDISATGDVLVQSNPMVLTGTDSGAQTISGLKTHTGGDVFNDTVNFNGITIFAGTPSFTVPTAFTSDLSVAGNLTATKFESACWADNYTGADAGAKINAASVACGANKAIRIPTGSYTYSTSIALAANQTLGDCSYAPEITKLIYTGSGVGLSTLGANAICGISFNFSSTTTDGLLLKGTQVRFQNGWVTGGGPSTKVIHVTAYDASTQSGNVYLDNIIGNALNGTVLYADHVVELQVSHSYFSCTGGGIGMVLDTGVSGVHFNSTSFSSCTNGGGVIKNLTPGVGAYNQYPNYLWFNNTVLDCAFTCPAADSLLFDSTLSTSPIYAWFVSSWTAGYGLNGIHISGGQGITIDDATIRSNGKSGIKIDNANVARVNIGTNKIMSNNISNDAMDGQGIWVGVGATAINIHDNDIANALDTTGHQKYGVCVAASAANCAAGAAVLADRLRIVNNNLSPNETGNQFVNETGAYNDCLNDSAPGDPASSRCWLSGDVQIGGSLFMNGGIFTGNINASGQYQIAGGVMFLSATSPTIAGAGCGGSGATVVNPNGTAFFQINVGTAPTAGGCTITLPSATHNWFCRATDITTNSTAVDHIKQSGAGTATSVTLVNYSDVAVATAPTASDVWDTTCSAN
jgi:hypothetical protein